MKSIKINQEKRSRKIAAIFDDGAKAEQAEETLINYGHFNSKDVKLIQPGDKRIRQKLEPETGAIGKTLLISHFIFGGLGLVLGLVIAAIVTTIGPVFAQSSPLLTYLALAIVGTFFGLFVAGLITLRPDHDPLINETIEASRHNKWAIVVHTHNHGDQQRARQLLQPVAVSVTDTF